MWKVFILIGVIAGLAGCASVQESPEDVCRSVNPSPNILALSEPVSFGSGIKVGSITARVVSERCEISSAVYVDTDYIIQSMNRPDAVEVVQSEQFHQDMVDRMTRHAQQALRHYPAGTVRMKHQYLPTPPLKPFVVEVEN